MERYEVAQADLVKLLIATGWLNESDSLSPQELQQMIADYQRFHGLRVDGWAGPVTERTLARRFCGVADTVGTAECRWRKNLLLVCLAGSPPSFDPETWHRAFSEACAAWSAVCDIAFKFTGDQQQADILVQVGRIDGASGTLAWSELPCAGDDRRLNQRYDQAEPFVIALNPPSARIDAVRVITHELGHALGCGHLATGTLMQPLYDPRIRTPQASDIAEMVRRYGPPKQQPSGPSGKSRVVIPGVGEFEGILTRAESLRASMKFGVIVNGREVDVESVAESIVSYEAIAKIAGYAGHTPSMTYSRAKFGRQGILSPGRSVEVVDGTVFSVADTSNA